MKILVTGAAGFIGFHLSRALLERGDEVVGLDNLNPYYDVRLKEARLELLRAHDGFTFVGADLEDRAAMERLFASEEPQVVVNLAAQAGVRYSLQAPQAYVSSNVEGFLNILEGCRHPWSTSSTHPPAPSTGPTRACPSRYPTTSTTR